MNLLFLTMSPFYDLDAHNIYSDLLGEFVAHGHKPYLVAPCEKKNGMPTELIDKGDYAVLRVRIGNTANVSFIEKGISTVLLKRQYIQAIKKHLKNISFDLILYSTPPITLAKPVKKLKKKFGCRTYLILKDIFPQNAVDLGMFSEHGLLYRYFRREEKQLYAVSDRVGCMSAANVEYVLKHNPEIAPECVELCPNAILPEKTAERAAQISHVREAYRIPDEAVVYLYGGNLGKPQGIPFLIDCLRDNINKRDRFFIICGTGSEFGLLKRFIDETQPQNVRLIDFLPKKEYDVLVQGCDVGLIFLDYRFTIPNYPSRMLSYMEQSMPVLSCTDRVSDINATIADGDFGWSTYSNDVKGFTTQLDEISASKEEIFIKGNNARDYLIHHFDVSVAYAAVTRTPMNENESARAISK